MHTMNNFNLERSINMSKGWIIGCSILTCGMMSYTYLNSMSNHSLMHLKRKNRLELISENKNIDLSDKILNEDKMISYYWNHFNIIYLMGIAGVSFVAYK